MKSYNLIQSNLSASLFADLFYIEEAALRGGNYYTVLSLLEQWTKPTSSDSLTSSTKPLVVDGVGQILLTEGQLVQYLKQALPM